MKKQIVITLSLIALFVLQFGCGSDSSTTKATSSNSYEERYEKQLAEKKEKEEKERTDEFARALKVFSQNVILTDLKLVEEYGGSRGWFSQACDMGRQAENVEDSLDVLTKETNADLIEGNRLVVKDLEDQAKAVFARYIYVVSQTGKTAGPTNRDEQGCGEGGSGSLLEMLVAADDYAYRYDLSLATNGFPKGTLRAMIVREVNLDLDENGWRQELLSPDRLTAKKAAEGIENHLSDIKSLGLTDAELRITPAMRKIIDNPPDTQE